MATRGTTQWQLDNWGPACRPTLSVARITGITVHVELRMVPAFEALGKVMDRYGYKLRSGVTGCYACRDVRNHPGVPSRHSWATALDGNTDTNPYRQDHLVTDMPIAMVEEIEALHTGNGARVFRWGGDWDDRPETPSPPFDAQHFEAFATPDELATGIIDPKESTIAPPRTIQITGDNSLYYVDPTGTIRHVTSPLNFYLLAKEGAISGASQRVVAADSDDAKALKGG